MAGELLFVSDREEDLAFGRSVANRNQMTFLSASDVAEVQKLRNQYPQMVVLWDVDHEMAPIDAHPCSVKRVGKALMEALPPDRVFAVSDKPLRETPHLFDVPAYGHHLFRHYQEPATTICSRLVKACSDEEPFGVGLYLPTGSKVSGITLTHSDQKGAAVKALRSALAKKGVPTRLAEMASQAIDELIMNAIFDAPVNESGERSRKMIERSAAVELGKRDAVEVELGQADTYIAVSVRDRFGSLDKETVLNFIRKDYKREKYEVNEDAPNAGLGIYGILASGMSLLFVSRYRRGTEVTLFFPFADCFKAFRESFRFFSFIMR